MKRRLAVPIALCNVGAFGRNTMNKTRKLKATHDDPDEYHVLAALASNRASIERLAGDIEHLQHEVDCRDVLNELEYLKADIELGLMEVTAEIEDTPAPEDILLQEAEAVYA
ncbi:MAG: hypothetical protein AB1793_02440 [Candidatus Thermoplasmatota archaeon]